jgi:hypothetical protein
MSIEYTGWIRDGHSVDIEVLDDGRVGYYLNHPVECHTTRDEWGDDPETNIPIKIINHHCMIGYESSNVGLGEENHWDEEPLPHLYLVEDILKHQSYMENVPIEYWVEHGTYEGYFGREYEWLLAWRLVLKGRDEDLANDEIVKKSHGHPKD